MRTDHAELEPVGRTARWTAAARAVESERSDRLFADEYAATLAGPEGFALMERFEAFTGGRNPVLPLRTRFYDDVLRAHVHHGETRQVVLLAAGLDTRAFRLTWPPGTTVFELDQPTLLTSKNAALTDLGAEPACDRRAVGADLTEDWTTALTDTGYTPHQPAVWIAEGLLSYLPEPAVEHLLRTTSQHSSHGSCIATDFIGKTFLTSPSMELMRAALTELGAPWLSGSDEPEHLLTACGWLPERVLQPGDPGFDFRELPFPTISRDVDAPGLPRLFFATALKDDEEVSK
ncbi:MAG: SAM-dependent methyltransferase [Pseudonocardiales bacterium]|nr:MAG: SAM-dependent methyltransferase [Pseudonocardiales bacterium]